MEEKVVSLETDIYFKVENLFFSFTTDHIQQVSKVDEII